jgi:hypothetical protein
VPGQTLRLQRKREAKRQMTEQMVEANGIEFWTEPFGDPAHPPILLIMGIDASFLWWEESFCRMLTDGGRFVIPTTTATPAARPPIRPSARATPAQTSPPTPRPSSMPTRSRPPTWSASRLQ